MTFFKFREKDQNQSNNKQSKIILGSFSYFKKFNFAKNERNKKLEQQRTVIYHLLNWQNLPRPNNKHSWQDCEEIG